MLTNAHTSEILSVVKRPLNYYWFKQVFTYIIEIIAN